MSSATVTSTPVLGTAHRKRVAIGATVGTTVENYDFIGYGTAAGLYFGHAFFPSEDPLTATLLSFATLGVGFAARPIGGIVGGYLGDKVGRKPVLIGSLLVMGLATFAIGLLPTYATVGALAPVLLVIVRIIQGLAFGAEWGGAILMTYEHAPWKKKGQYGAIPQAGFPLGLLLANLAFLASSPLPGDWAWRVPFLLSALLIGAGIYIRLRITESPEFETAKEDGELESNPLRTVITRDWRNLLRAFGMRIAETAGYAVAITYLTAYVRDSGFASTSQTILALVIAALLGFPATLLWGRLTDRVGRKPVYLFGTAVMVVMGVPFFLLVQSGELLLVVAVFVISFAVVQNCLAGTQSAWFPELFSTGTRSSGASLAYQLAAVISGFTAFWCVSLFDAFGWTGPAVLYSAYGLVGLVAALSTRETFGARRRREVDEATAAAEPMTTTPSPASA
ncbi:MFS transporter [Quadrisphaera oryzae]|uniref:MFS transporter n=1 Tax=Quadrisphaera TaxID=317661 RepID=UPI001646FB08|nr:MFS transporter [Quadrisphaera sp. RL12-1S]MBC3760239.1 MHS family MFS transporter [Quadrisphaera sp. RL12-1S]